MDEDFFPARQKDYMDKLILDLMKDGKDINEILSMHYHFLIEILRDKNNPKQRNS
ncbi:phage tail assembly chaperone GT [Peribacillus butanolivorans]|uniref:phage tail assembly chaperone GT n=1 Tax=Peribacillus butanolivorans TaxID=421767 RepID=UPI00399C82E2